MDTTVQVSYFKTIISCYSIMVSTAGILATKRSVDVFAIMGVVLIRLQLVMMYS
jgi:hypothetical protein